MGWTKNREKLHEAAISTIRAISKNKDISSNIGLSQRPPTSNHIVVPSVPRSIKNIYEWRGESDFQAFWFLFHKNTKDFPLTLPAKMIFNELEIARVEQGELQEFVTETQYNSVKTALDASAVLDSEAMTAEMSGDTSTATTKRNEATTKYNEAKTALLAL